MHLVLHLAGTPLCHTAISTLFRGGMLCCRQFCTTEPAACRFASRRILVPAYSRIIRLNLRTNDRAGAQRFALSEGVRREDVAAFESALNLLRTSAGGSTALPSRFATDCWISTWSNGDSVPSRKARDSLTLFDVPSRSWREPHAETQHQRHIARIRAARSTA
jgi:hypothetical protein